MIVSLAYTHNESIWKYGSNIRNRYRTEQIGTLKRVVSIGILVLEIPGLVYGGCQEIRYSETCGYLVFIQNERDHKTNEMNKIKQIV